MSFRVHLQEKSPRKDGADKPIEAFEGLKKLDFWSLGVVEHEKWLMPFKTLEDEE